MVILNDLERGRILRYFTEFSRLGTNYVKLVEVRLMLSPTKT